MHFCRDCLVYQELLVTLEKMAKLVYKVQPVYLVKQVPVAYAVSLENVDLLAHREVLDHAVLLV